MVRLNKNLLSEVQIQTLLKQFAKILNYDNPKQSLAVLTEILGPEEQIMIAKRIAVIVLYVENFSSYKISRTVKLSESTVAKIISDVKKGEYDNSLKNLNRSKKNYFKILETIDSVLQLGGLLPHYNGPRYHWRS